MKVLLLGVDINRSSCDPALYFEENSREYNASLYLDETATRIADFTNEVRKDCDKVAWTLQNVATSADRDPEPMSPEERAFHRVLPFENEDAILPKTQMSAYPEHEEFFDKLKEEGVDTVVLTGFYASKCIYWTMDSLLDNGFKVIVPTDLIADSTPNHPMASFDDFMNQVYHGQLVFTDSERVAEMILAPEEDRKPPVATYTWSDINNLHYGPGS